MSSPRFEAFLAKIYVDADARERLLKDPRGEAKRAGLSDAECDAIEKMDFVGLGFAARSFESKRQKAETRKKPSS